MGRKITILYSRYRPPVLNFISVFEAKILIN